MQYGASRLSPQQALLSCRVWKPFQFHSHKDPKDSTEPAAGDQHRRAGQAQLPPQKKKNSLRSRGSDPFWHKLACELAHLSRLGSIGVSAACRLCLYRTGSATDSSTKGAWVSRVSPAQGPHSAALRVTVVVGESLDAARPSLRPATTTRCRTA